MCFCWHLVNRTNIINMQYAQVASILFGHGSRLDWLDTQELHKNSFLSRSQSRSSRSSLLPSPRLLYNSPGALLSKTSTLEISLPNTLKQNQGRHHLGPPLNPLRQMRRFWSVVRQPCNLRHDELQVYDFLPQSQAMKQEEKDPQGW